MDFADIKACTRAVYERNAAGWDAHRPKTLMEATWLDRFLSVLPRAPAVLELGCGAGEPMARYMIERGCRYTGIDYASSMLALAEARFPTVTLRRADMRTLVPEETYDGVVSWDAFFHLDSAEQTALLDRMPDWIAPGGALLLTVGDREGEVIGRVEGEPVYHASLAPGAYRQRLGARFESVDIVLRDPNCGAHSVLLARGRT